MNKYHIGYETDYCDDFPEITGECKVVAKSEEQALNGKTQIILEILVNIKI